MAQNKDQQLYINDIKRALGNGNAVVMIGAGFSLNAHNGHHLKDWFSIGHEFKKAIEGRDDVLRPSSAQEVMDLGEQYEALFGRTKLNNILKKMLPDTLVSPDDLHKKLLELPWNDVFTTNYDTLLERAADNLVIADHKYFPVYNAEDLPQSRVVNTKRIVKLHGSFPSNEPFIFTAEDYRTYPQKFAPFINTVKQALLENTMCLIGFSGADPNFIEWIGWIRDILNEHSLPIYLMLSKMPSEGEQRVLASRKIIPVLYPVPDSLNKYSYIDRINYFLELINPNSADLWADPFDEKITSDLKSIHRLLESLGTNNSLKLEDIENNHWLQVFTYEFNYLKKLKISHPGWLITPNEFRLKLKHSHISRLKIFTNTYKYRNLAILDLPIFSDNICNRIYYYSYYFWVKDILLEPVELPTLIKITKLILDDLDTLKQNSDLYNSEKSLFLDESLNEFSSHVVSTVISLLEKTRRCGLFSEYDSLISIINDSQYYCDDIKSEISYQNILLELSFGDHKSAQRLLSSWNVQQGQFLAQLRKSNLLLELDRVDEAEKLLRVMVKEIRLLQRHQTEGFFLISVEAYALEIISRVKRIVSISGFSNNEKNQGLGEETLTPIEELPYEKSRVLKDSEYHINHEILIITSRLNEEQDHNPLLKKGEAAYALIALYDRIGLSFKYYDISYDISIGLKSAWYLQYLDLSIFMPLSIVHRMYDANSIGHKDTNSTIYSRYWFNQFQIANISDDYFDRLYKKLLGQLENYCNVNYVRVAKRFSYDIRLYTLIAVSPKAIESFTINFKKLISLFVITLENRLFRRPDELKSLKDGISLFIDAASSDVLNELLLDLMSLHDLFNDRLSGSHLGAYNINIWQIKSRIDKFLDERKSFSLTNELHNFLNLKIEKLLTQENPQSLISNDIAYIIFFAELDWIQIEQLERINHWLNADTAFCVLKGFYHIVLMRLAKGTSFEQKVELTMINYIRERLSYLLKKREINDGSSFEEIDNLAESVHDYLLHKNKSVIDRKDLESLIDVVFLNMSRNITIGGIDFESLAYRLDNTIAVFISMNFSKGKQIELIEKKITNYREYFVHSYRLLNLVGTEISLESWNKKMEQKAFEFIDLPTLLTSKFNSFFENIPFSTPTIVELVDMFYFWYQVNDKQKGEYNIDRLTQVILVQMSSSHDLEYLYDRCQILFHLIHNAPNWFRNQEVKKLIYNKMNQVRDNLKVQSNVDQFKFKDQLHWIVNIRKELDQILNTLNKIDG